VGSSYGLISIRSLDKVMLAVKTLWRKITYASLSARLRMIVLGSSLTGLLLFAIITIFHEFYSEKQTLLEEIQVLSQIVAARSSAATAYSDVEAANDNLSSLLIKKDIDFACIHTITRLLAFRKSSRLPDVTEGACLSKSTSTPYYFTNNYVYVFEPIVINNNHIGWVTVRANLSYIKRKIKKNLALLIFVTLTVLLICYFFSSTLIEIAIKPIKNLKNVTEKIGDKKDYSIRATYNRLDETGVLVKSFNNMLDVIEQKDRLKSLFFSNMNHEIRAPLNGLMGVLQLMQTSDLDEQQQHYTQIALDSGQHILSLINDILDFSKLDEHQFTVEKLTCQITKTLFECINPMAIRAEEKFLDFEFYMEPIVPMVIKSDPTRLKQVITNLVNNAIKFCEKGSVTVKVDVQFGQLVISITDTGIGIPANRLDVIFSPYTQAKDSTSRVFGGTGLGLSISKKIILLLGGEINVNSVEGRGSTFYFSLPLNDAHDETLHTYMKSLSDKVDVSNVVFAFSGSSDRNLNFIKNLFSYAGVECIDLPEGSPVQDPLLFESAINQDLIPAIILSFSVGMARNQLNKIDFLEQSRGVVFGPLSLEPEFHQMHQKRASRWFYVPIPVDPMRLYKTILAVISEVQSVSLSSSSVLNEAPYSHMIALVAEDNKTNQMIIRKMLEKFGLITEVVDDGLECLKRLKAGNSYDVVFMDCDMPVMDGFAATELIREFKITSRTGRAIPVIALTGRTEEQDMKRCYVSGMDFHLQKPIELDALKLVLSQIVL